MGFCPFGLSLLLTSVWSRCCQFYPLSHAHHDRVEHANTAKLGQYVPSSQSPFSASSQKNLLSASQKNLLSAWWDGTREREAPGFSTVWQVWMRMRPRGGGGVKLIKPPHALVLICSYILIWSCAHMPIYPSYPRRWRRLGINMHTFIYLATVATTSFVVFYLIFYFILSDVPA